MQKLNLHFYHLDRKEMQIILSFLLSLSLFFLNFKIALISTFILLPFILWNIFKEPVSGIYSLLIIIASVKPVPDTLDLPVIIFIILCFAVFIKFLYDIDIQYLKKNFTYAENKIILLFGIFLIINLFVALNNNITLAEWIRGAIPFVFIVYIFFICQRYFKTKRDIQLCLASIVVSGIILLTKCLGIFFFEKLWTVKPYLYNDNLGIWEKTTVEKASNFFCERITMICPQSTDAIHFICFFILITFLCLSNFSKKNKLIYFLLAYIFFFLMVVTYSRTFMLVLTLGFSFLIALSFYKKDYKLVLKYIGLMLFSIFFVWLVIQTFKLPLFTNRYLALLDYNNFSSNNIAQIALKITEVDTNISARLEEYTIGSNLFKKKPILGNGLGVKHSIYYDIGFGRKQRFTKGYIHNWLFYFLMTSGILGTLIYLSLYIIPIIRGWKLIIKNNYFVLTLIFILSILLLNSYAMLFASFRLIGFNLLLGIMCSIPISLRNISE